jgi:hypothetical protein
MRVTSCPYSPAHIVVCAALLGAALASEGAAQPAAPEPCNRPCVPVSWDTYTVIRLSEVEPGLCGISPDDKGEIRDLEPLQGADVQWRVCSVCPYDAKIEFNRWTGTLTRIFESTVPPIGASNTLTLPVEACSEKGVTGKIKVDAEPIRHDFRFTVWTGLQSRDYDPGLQIREGPGRLKLLWLLLSGLLGLGGGTLVGRYLWRARR